MALLGVALAAAVVVGCNRVDSHGGDSASGLNPSQPMAVQQAIGAYAVRIIPAADGRESSGFEIFRRGKKVYEASGDHFHIGPPYEDESVPQIRPGSNLTGNGIPDLVVKEWTGGAHCCYRLHVFELGERFRFIQTIEAEHSDLAWFENLDEDPALELAMNDWSFAYWRTSFATSPAPRVVLKYRDGRYRVAPELMRRSPPSPESFREMAREIRSEPEWAERKRPPVILWRNMLDLLYTGNAREAWSLLDLAWPAECAGKERFQAEFKEQLANSRYWRELTNLAGFSGR